MKLKRLKLKRLKSSYILGLLLVCLCLFACNSEPKKENIVSGNPNVLPVDAKTKAKSKINLKQQQDRAGKTTQTSGELFEWNADTEKAFLTNCIETTSQNKIVNANKYCPCILDLLKEGYTASELNKAVKENPKKAAACLRISIRSDSK